MSLFNRSKFFEYARRAPFGNRMSQEQVDGVSVILDQWESFYSHLDTRFLAYILATAFHETGARMVPVREGFAKTDASARKIVSKYKYGIPDPKTGHVYYGRGLVQLTWAKNYKRLGEILDVDLLNNPDLALRSDLSARILIEGMIYGVSGKGDFTGLSLEQFFNSATDDPVGARKIINGTDKASLIASYHRAFLDSLNAALSGAASTEVEGRPQADGANLLTDKTIVGALTAGAGGAAASLFGSISNPFALAAFVVVAIGVFMVLTGRVEIKHKIGA